jgi:hypothetical protein
VDPNHINTSYNKDQKKDEKVIDPTTDIHAKMKDNPGNVECVLLRMLRSRYLCLGLVDKRND